MIVVVIIKTTRNIVRTTTRYSSQSGLVLNVVDLE